MKPEEPALMSSTRSDSATSAFKSDEHVHVIGHVVDGDEFLFLTGHDTGDVFLEFVIVSRWNQTLSAFDSKHDVNVNLGVRVGHPNKMSLPTELVNSIYDGLLQRYHPSGVKFRNKRTG
jgi:hypothetical protein